MTRLDCMAEEISSRAKASARTRHAELLLLCARMGFNP